MDVLALVRRYPGGLEGAAMDHIQDSSWRMTEKHSCMHGQGFTISLPVNILYL